MARIPGSGSKHGHLARGWMFNTAQGASAKWKNTAPFNRYNAEDGRSLEMQIAAIIRRLYRSNDASRRNDIADAVRRAINTEKAAGKVQSSQRPQARRNYSNSDDGGTYTGAAPRSRVAGKKRSVSVVDVYKPSLELREDESPSRRIGSLTRGGAAGRRQSGATMLSNFGANKENGGGWLGASASRMRGAVNLVKHPETWMSRFAWVYIAKHVTQSVQDWRGWNKVSWMDTDGAAQKKLNDHNKGNQAERAIFSGLGGASKIALDISKVTSGIGSGIGSMFMDDVGEADMARADSLIDAFGEYMGKGYKGVNPLVFLDMIDSASAATVSDAKAKAAITGRRRYDKAMTDGLVRMKDQLALRGAGGVEELRSALNKRSDFKAALDKMTAADIDYSAVPKVALDRMNRENANKRFFGYNPFTSQK